MERYKSIGLKETEYNTLAMKKKELEATTGRQFSWGLFLLLLVGLKALSEANQRGNTFEFHQSETPATPEQLEEAGIREVEGIPVTLGDTDKERIADLVLSKMGERLIR